MQSEDDDCDNQSDEGTDADAPIGSPTWYLDFDGDGIGTDSLSTISCFAPPDFVSQLVTASMMMRPSILKRSL